MTTGHAVGKIMCIAGCRQSSHQVLTDHSLFHPLISIGLNFKKRSFEPVHIFHPSFIGIHITIIMRPMMETRSIDLKSVLIPQCILRTDRQIIRESFHIPDSQVLIRLIQCTKEQMWQHIIHIIRIHILPDGRLILIQAVKLILEYGQSYHFPK